jgi:hypothetical protein
MSKAAKECFETLIYPLGLSICLRMVGGAEMQGGASHFEQQLPKGACEDLVTITDDRLWQAVETKHLIHEQLGDCCSCEWMFERQEVGKLGKGVDDDQDGVCSTRRWQSFYEVH